MLFGLHPLNPAVSCLTNVLSSITYTKLQGCFGSSQEHDEALLSCRHKPSVGTDRPPLPSSEASSLFPPSQEVQMQGYVSRQKEEKSQLGAELQSVLGGARCPYRKEGIWGEIPPHSKMGRDGGDCAILVPTWNFRMLV